MGAEIDFASTFMAANIFSLAIVIGFNIADGGSQNGSQFPLLRDTEHCYLFHFITFLYGLIPTASITIYKSLCSPTSTFYSIYSY